MLDPGFNLNDSQKVNIQSHAQHKHVHVSVLMSLLGLMKTAWLTRLYAKYPYQQQILASCQI